MNLFAPTPAGTVVLAATTTSGSVQLLPLHTGPAQVRVYNDGTTMGYIEFGDSNAVTATVTSIPIPSGQPCGFTIANPQKGSGQIWAAVKMASGTANFSFTLGDGI